MWEQQNKFEQYLYIICVEKMSALVVDNAQKFGEGACNIHYKLLYITLSIFGMYARTCIHKPNGIDDDI